MQTLRISWTVCINRSRCAVRWLSLSPLYSHLLLSQLFNLCCIDSSSTRLIFLSMLSYVYILTSQHNEIIFYFFDVRQTQFCYALLDFAAFAFSREHAAYSGCAVSQSICTVCFFSPRAAKLHLAIQLGSIRGDPRRNRRSQPLVFTSRTYRFSTGCVKFWLTTCSRVVMGL